MAKVIFHIDLNAFFANAEILRNSALEGQPIAVGGRSKRGVICTASYEAREYGVKAAMPLYEALELCPNLIVLNSDIDYYKEVSNRFFNYLRKYTNLIEIASIDECYMDVTDIIKNYKRPLDLAWEIQTGLLKNYKLKCSIGVGPTKFLAKMASDMRKPLGITVLRRSDIPKKLWPLPIEEMYGIGKKSSKILKEKGINTIYDLVNPNNEMLAKSILKRQYLPLVNSARGYGSDKVIFSRTIQSLSQSNTYNDDICDYQEICGKFKELAIKLSERCKHKRVTGNLISVSIRYYDFKNIVRSKNLDKSINDYETIYEQALQLFDDNYNGNPIRHLGITIGSLKSSVHHFEQLDLFSNHQPKKDILAELNEDLTGDNKLIYASELLKNNKL